MASFRLGFGDAFNAATMEWTHGLAAGDPYVELIALNGPNRVPDDGLAD